MSNVRTDRGLISRLSWIAILMLLTSGTPLGSTENMQQVEGILDDRRYPDMRTPVGTEWRLVADSVMGGISQGRLLTDIQNGVPCLRLSGDVSTANNGGFIQMTLDIPRSVLAGIDRYEGVEVKVAGNEELYNLHLKTTDLRLPWQSFRSPLRAQSSWRTFRFPFSDFQPHRTDTKLETSRLNRIALVAIGRDFEADICLADLRLYPSD